MGDTSGDLVPVQSRGGLGVSYVQPVGDLWTTQMAVGWRN